MAGILCENRKTALLSRSGTGQRQAGPQNKNKTMGQETELAQVATNTTQTWAPSVLASPVFSYSISFSDVCALSELCCLQRSINRFSLHETQRMCTDLLITGQASPPGENWQLGTSPSSAAIPAHRLAVPFVGLTRYPQVIVHAAQNT